MKRLIVILVILLSVGAYAQKTQVKNHRFRTQYQYKSKKVKYMRKNIRPNMLRYHELYAVEFKRPDGMI